MKKHLITLKNILIYLAIYFITQIAGTMGAFIIYSIFNAGKSENLVEGARKYIMNNAYIITLASAVLALIIYYFTLKSKEETLKDKLQLNKVDFKTSIIIIILTLGNAMFACSLVTLLQDKFPSYKETAELVSSASTSVLAMSAIIIFLPIFEEILFRGLIFHELKKSNKFILAIIFQALIFGIIHGNPLQAIYASILGVYLGLIYHWTSSLWASSSAHIVYNLLGSSIFPIILDKTQNLVYVYIVVGLVISVGGMVLIYKNYAHENKTLNV